MPKSELPNRPDVRIDELNLIIEFDGHLHYTLSKTVLKDQTCNKDWQNLGYNVVRIPYFVQPTRYLMEHWFAKYGVDCTDVVDYGHGFVDNLAVLPADFCSLGWNRFVEEYEHFIKIDMWHVSLEIYKSLQLKSEILGVDRVLPSAFTLDPNKFLDKYSEFSRI